MQPVPGRTTRPFNAALVRAVISALITLNLLLILGWWWTNSASVASGTNDILIALGRLAGLIAGFGVLMQLLHMARLLI